MPRYEAFINKGWETRGICNLAILRTREDGWLEAGVLLVDVFCLGVKDAFAVEMAASDWAPRMNSIIPVEDREAIHPACARKLVEGSVAYAESLGFAPPRDYNKARRVFGSVKAADCPRSFIYGREGKPLFVAGPDDDETRIERVMRMLTAKLGSDGFHYLVPADPDTAETDEFDDDEAASEQLLELFTELGRENDLLALGGICAAVSVSLADIGPEDLVPVLWAGNPPPSWTAADSERLTELIADYCNETADRLDEGEDNGQPENIPHFVDQFWECEDELRERASAWCRGFMRVVRLFPAEWGPVTRDPELKLLVGIVAGIAQDGRVMMADGAWLKASDLPRCIGALLLKLRAAFLADETGDDPAANR